MSNEVKSRFHALHPECGEWWHKELYRMLKNDEIVKPEVCTNKECQFPGKYFIHGHSPDYSISPKMNVEWLCADCHAKRHGWPILAWTKADAKYVSQKVIGTLRRNGALKARSQKSANTKRENGTDKITAQKIIATLRKNGTLNKRNQKIADARRRNGSYKTGAQKAANTMRLSGAAKVGAQKAIRTQGGKDSEKLKERAQKAVKTQGGKGSEQLHERAQKREDNMTLEQKSLRSQKRLQTMSRDDFVEIARKREANMTVEQKRARTRSGNETLGFEGRSKRARRGCITRKEKKKKIAELLNCIKRLVTSKE